MTNRASAHRYARALFDVVLKEAVLETAETDLAAFANLLAVHSELKRVLTNPAVPAPSKRAVVDTLVERLRPQAPVGKLLVLLAERDRLELLPELIDAFRERLMEHQRVVRAEVVTAVPMPTDKAAQLQQRLGVVTGRTVTMHTRVEPAILGGVIAKVGSIVYDGSVATQLAKMRDKLAETV